MKQLLFLLLFPCLCVAQYTGNAGQKITLGEQTSADGLVYRGNAADTVAATLKITKTNKSDTSAFLLLDTINNVFLKYNIGTTYWTRLNILPTDTASMLGNYWRSGKFSGVLPVANGGTGYSTLAAAGINTGSGTSNYLPKYTGTTTLGNSIIFDNGTNVGIGTTTNTSQKLNVNGDLLTTGKQYVGTTSVFLDYSGGDLVLCTGGADKMIIQLGGNVGIGTTIIPSAKLNVMGTVRINSASAPDANYYLQLENSASQKAKANAWDTYSDKRIKTDIQPILNAIDKVNLLNPVYYQKHDSYVENDFLNIDYESSVKSLGFIAQEVYKIIPEAVNTGTINELWAMDYTKIIPILTKAIQEQNALIKALEQRILILENK